MATAAIPTLEPIEDDTTQNGLGPVLNQILAPLASLKLTVALLLASIFLILAGTLAQVDKDIWEVIDLYFHTWVALIDFQVFIPPSFWKAFFSDGPVPQIPGMFPFPGGRLIGSLMAVNLLAAHLIRFRVQSRGWPLISGLLVILAGGVLTTLVVSAANNPDGLQGEAWISYDVLWWVFLTFLAAACAGSAYGWFHVPSEQKKTQWLVGGTVLAQAAVLSFLIVYSGRGGRLSDSAMRILWQLTQGGGVALVLLVGCLLVFQKRAGVVLLHGGIGLLMLGELLVSMTAVESQLQMQEGETVNFVQDIRTIELAIVDHSGKETDKVTVIPRQKLVDAAKSGQPIRHDLLPFDIEVKQFLQNAGLRRRKKDETTPATKGNGLDYAVDELRPGSGTDTDGKTDLSAAYVTFKSKTDGSDLGTYLLGIIFSAQNSQETVAVGDRTYEASLRFQRHYKPYRFQLVDVRKDDYVGTSTPKNYSSDVRLVDSTRNVDRTLKIWMNNPLRFAGETFYQSGYHRDPTTQIEGTTLQVVTNSGWMIPYISCMIVAMGMLAHFCLTLWRFLQRAEQEGRPGVAAPRMIGGKLIAPKARETEIEPELARSGSGWIGWIVPVNLALLAVFWTYYASKPMPVSKEGYDLAAFGTLPVVSEGRAKPFDTLARTSLLVLSSGRQTYTDHNEHSQPAIRWLLDVMASPENAFKHRVFRIENEEVMKVVGIERRERFRYAPEEFLPKLQELTEQVELARKQDAGNVSTYQKKVLELEKKIGVLDLLLQSYSPPNIRPEKMREDLMQAVSRQRALLDRHPPLVIPPTETDAEWDTFASAWTKNLVKTIALKQEPDVPTESLTRILVAYAKKDATEFNKEVGAYRAWLKEHPPADYNAQKIEFEAFFNRFQPFMVAQYQYVIAFLFGALAWFGATTPWYWKTMSRTALLWALAAFLLHTFALASRIYISGRPPVTNLYSSAVFIGWGCAGLGLAMNLFYRNGLGTILAAVCAYLTLGVANHLAADGDTFVVLQAVLDTQFWLATHVTCITFGYATTYVAALLGLAYVILGVATPALRGSLGKDLTRMTYGALCFSIFFSFVGTVLGGLWADDSWGRFWGWDPKENGALMIVLWNAVCLHARWGAMVKERGLAILSILGGIVVSWSWFGVNELGIGLHAYGQTEGRLFALAMTCLFLLGVAGLGCLPRAYWFSGLPQSKADVIR